MNIPQIGSCLMAVSSLPARRKIRRFDHQVALAIRQQQADHFGEMSRGNL